MKKNAIFGLLVIILVFCFIGCGDDDDDNENLVITRTIIVNNLPQDGNFILWLRTAFGSQPDFFDSVVAVSGGTISNGTGTFLLKNPDKTKYPSYTDWAGVSNWNGTGSSFYVVIIKEDMSVLYGNTIAFSISEANTTILYDNSWGSEE